MIYYFTGTGNSKYAAEKLAVKTGDRAVSMTDVLGGKAEIVKDDRTGFVFPVYFEGLPEIVKRFASAIKDKLGSYVYCVITCGARTGATAQHLEKALETKIDYSFSLRMPDNYVVMYDPCSKEKALRFLRHADKELDGVCEDIKAKAKRNDAKFADKAITAVMYPFYNLFRTTSKFYADSNCVSCGMCVKNCPDSAIEMQNGKPVWIKSKCQHCTACINRCPQKSIQFGKMTAGRTRYNIWEITK